VNRPWQSADEREEPHPDELECDCREDDCEGCGERYRAHLDRMETQRLDAALPAWRERMLHLFGADFLESDNFPY